MVQFPGWSSKPITGLELSAGGLLALADLSTIAERTAITGGSSWLDSLILAPGLHYQQAADELAKWSGASAIVNAVEDQDGKPMTFRVNNAATANYIQKIARPGQTVTLYVGAIPAKTSRYYRVKRSNSGLHATIWAEDAIPDLGWVSHALYLVSPVLTVASIVFTVLFQDWWTLAFILALMLSRLLNIWVIKQRAQPESLSSPATQGMEPAYPQNRLTTYKISMVNGSHCSVNLRGMSEDLQAITTEAWLRSKTHIEGYLEAMAKLLVYMVAALSGNMTQAGAIIMMALLLTTAGLLALSNSNAKAFEVNGRVTVPESRAGAKGKDKAPRTATHGSAASKVIEGEALRASGRQGDADEKAGDLWVTGSAGSNTRYNGNEMMHDRAEKGEIRSSSSSPQVLEDR
ncbi:hypothetical protein B0T22DRAFT_45939 [Podospora appendiculata]|uniref:Uncharacterized protein n=1 Tax=Podospora appendiculata TaxID=314037 RepID=A0AAE1CGN6_9PEZI|nr:hypothetical protein B0T22DRAFT_45939 [Podospora appendiculata]